MSTALVESPSTTTTTNSGHDNNAMTMAVVKVATALIIIIREWGDWKYSGAHSDTKGCADEANQMLTGNGRPVHY